MKKTDDVIARAKAVFVPFRPYLGDPPAPSDCDTDYLDCPDCGEYNNHPHKPDCCVFLGLQVFDALVEQARLNMAWERRFLELQKANDAAPQLLDAIRNVYAAFDSKTYSLNTGQRYALKLVEAAIANIDRDLLRK